MPQTYNSGMLDINQLRRDLGSVTARLEARKKPQPYLRVEAFQSLENERKSLQTHTETLQSRRNALSKQIGQLKAKGESAEAVMAEVGQIKTDLETSAARLEALQAEGLLLPVLTLGLPDRFIEHGDPVKLLAQEGLDAPGIEKAIRQRLSGHLDQMPGLKSVA